MGIFNMVGGGGGGGGGGEQGYRATQGPSPYGFHVPTKDDWESLYNAYTGLGLSGSSNFSIYLKLPFAGNRTLSSSYVNKQGSGGFYWSSTCADGNGAYYLTFNSSAVYTQYSSHRANGNCIRCFKNIPVIPTSSWTTLYDGSSVASGAGVFWDSSKGIISISGDGINWITIQDKNLGATTVYNSGDTLSEANCGKYYQRGNNYGFPWTGTVTTSSTQVNVSTYGPGNYYSSSTFIIRTSSPFRWDTTDNHNLRGGEDGNVPV